MGAKQLHYCNILAMITTGCYVASYGPLIPFFAAATHLDQTHYAYLFLVRASANVIGSLLLKKIAPIVPVRRLLLLLCTGLAVALTVSTFSLSTLNLMTTFFVASICIVMLNIVIVSFNFAAFSPEEGTHHIQVLGFVFGAGAMAAPFVVMYLQLSTYLLLALLCLGLAPLYLTQQLPSLTEHETSISGKLVISSRSQLLICLMMVIYATQEIGMSSWIPTYAIKAGVTDYARAGIYSMYFWVPSCLFRLIWLAVPLSFDQKLRTIVVGLVLTTSVGLFLQLIGRYDWVCVVGPVSSGILLSNLYAFFLALPVQKGFVFTSSNSAHLVIANCLGEGLLITPLGWSMGFWGAGSLMVALWLLSGLLWYCYGATLGSLEKDHNEHRERLLQHADSSLIELK